MGLTALPRRALEAAASSADEPAMRIRDEQIDAGQAAAFEPGEEGGPAGLRLAVAHLQSEDLAIAGRAHAHGHQPAERAHAHALALALAHAHAHAHLKHP